LIWTSVFSQAPGSKIFFYIINNFFPNKLVETSGD
jgi:hypothetical protein